jgi:epoxide hydrolase 4
MDRREEMVKVGDVALHVVSQGTGPAVVLLHGFPEFWYSWRWQLEALAAAGFTAIAPDLRGYNLSGKPAGVDSYRIEKVGSDIVELIRAAAGGRAHVVGHDWGGAVAWWLAATYPEHCDRLVTLNGPHGGALLRAARSPAQVLRSWYILFFQLPWLPERLVLHPSFMRRTLRHHAVTPATFSDQDLERYREAIQRPGAASAAINYYRAALHHLPLPPRRVSRPTLVVWGDRDQSLGPEVLRALDGSASDQRIEHVPDAGHFVHQDRPDEVNRLLLEFLAA